jgi:hypothetical protein
MNTPGTTTCIENELIVELASDGGASFVNATSTFTPAVVSTICEPAALVVNVGLGVIVRPYIFVTCPCAESANIDSATTKTDISKFRIAIIAIPSKKLD